MYQWATTHPFAYQFTAQARLSSNKELLEVCGFFSFIAVVISKQVLGLRLHSKSLH